MESGVCVGTVIPILLSFNTQCADLPIAQARHVLHACFACHGMPQIQSIWIQRIPTRHGELPSLDMSMIVRLVPGDARHLISPGG